MQPIGKRPLVSLALLGWYCMTAGAQDTSLLEVLGSTDLRAGSLKTLQLVGEEVRTIDSVARSQSSHALEKGIAARGLMPVSTDQMLKAMQADFEASVKRAQAAKADHELTLKIGKQAGMYGVDMFGRVIEDLPGTWGQVGGLFVAPLMQRGVETFLDLKVDEALRAKEQDFARIIKERFAIYVAQGNSLPTEQQLARVFDTVLGDALGTTAAERSIMNREAIRFAATYLSAHDQEIQQLANQLRNQDLTIKEMEGRTRDELMRMRADIENTVYAEIDKVADGLAVLANQQRLAAERIGNLDVRVTQNESRIRELQRVVRLQAGDIETLQRITEEHARLIAENKVHVDVISAYTFQGLGVGQQLAALDNGHFDHIFSPSEKEHLRADLEVARTVERINDALKVGSEIAGVLMETGLLKDDDARNVATAIEAIGSVIGIGVGVYSGNPMAAVTGAMNLVRIGTGRAPEESAETKMLRRLDAKLDRIEQNMVVVDKKLNYLIDFTEKAYQQLAVNLANHHAMMVKSFERIDWRMDHSTRIGLVLLKGDLEKCSNRQTNGPLPASFGEYLDRYNSDAAFFLEDCLRGLRDVTQSGQKIAAVYYERASDSLNEILSKQLEYEIKVIYDPARELFCRYFGLDGSEKERAYDARQVMQACLRPQHRKRVAMLGLAVNQLVVPAKTKQGQHELRSALRAETLEERVPPELALGQMLSPQTIDFVSAALMDLSTYFEITSSGSSFRPYGTARGYLKLKADIRRKRKSNVSRMLESALQFSNCALAQQVLLSGAPLLGRMYHTLHAAGATRREKELVLHLLQSNPIIAHNFAVDVLQRAFSVAPDGTPRPCSAAPAEPCFRRLQTLYETIVDPSTTAPQLALSLRDLNAAATPSGVVFRAEGGTLWVTHPNWRLGESPSVQVLVPSPEWLIRTEIAYSEAVYEMLDVKARLLDALLSVNIPENLATSDVASVQLDHYRWLLLQQPRRVGDESAADAGPAVSNQIAEP